jgi:hypothetical protein
MLVATGILTALAGSVGAQVREQRPNSIGGEVLGRGLILTLNASAGTTYAGGGDVGDYEDTWLLTISAGYQFHSTSGFFVRPLFTLFLPTDDADDEYLVWPGV